MTMRGLRGFVRRLIGLGTRRADDERVTEEMSFRLERLA